MILKYKNIQKLNILNDFLYIYSYFSKSLLSNNVIPLNIITILNSYITYLPVLLSQPVYFFIKLIK